MGKIKLAVAAVASVTLLQRHPGAGRRGRGGAPAASLRIGRPQGAGRPPARRLPDLPDRVSRARHHRGAGRRHPRQRRRGGGGDLCDGPAVGLLARRRAAGPARRRSRSRSRPASSAPGACSAGRRRRCCARPSLTSLARALRRRGRSAKIAGHGGRLAHRAGHGVRGGGDLVPLALRAAAGAGLRLVRRRQLARGSARRRGVAPPGALARGDLRARLHGGVRGPRRQRHRARPPAARAGATSSAWSRASW